MAGGGLATLAASALGFPSTLLWDPTSWNTKWGPHSHFQYQKERVVSIGQLTASQNSTAQGKHKFRINVRAVLNV